MSGYGLGGWGIVEPWGSIIIPGPPTDISPGDFEFEVIARSEGYRIRVKFSAPSVADAPDWSRRLVILRKQYEWPQAWDDDEAYVVIDDIFPIEGSYIIDEYDLVQNQIYYYTLFALRTDGAWIQDPVANRGSAYPYDRWGASAYMYQSLPNGWRSSDTDEGGDLQNFMSIFGALVDNIKTDCEHLMTLFDFEEIHADLIWVLDKKIGWPTWHAAGGIQKRKESLDAVALYGVDDPVLLAQGTETGIGIGRAAAYEAILEEIAEWDVELVEGWKYVMFSNGVFGSITPDTTDVDTVRLMGRKEDIVKYVNDGVGWHSVSGIAFFLYEILGISDAITAEILDRYRELIDWAKASYVNVGLLIVPMVEERFLMTRVLDEDDMVWTYLESYPLTIETDLGYTTSSASLFLSTTAASTTNTLADRTFHEALEYV